MLQDERGARLGADVAHHRLLRPINQPAEGGHALPALPTQRRPRTRLHTEATENTEVRLH